MKNHYNRVHLLGNLKMMEKNWRALTPESLVSEILCMSDEEILEFMLLSDNEINDIEIEIDKFVEENRG